MLKWMNTIFLSICFLAAFLVETYFIQRQGQDLLTIIGIGMVVLILGYLILDSLRNQWKAGIENTKLIADKTFQEESEKWDERFSELEQLQKANYVATKKNAMLIEQMEDIQERLKNQENMIQRLLELQKKSMEGQKNALNMEMNFSKDNTKRIIKVIRSEAEKLKSDQQIQQSQEPLLQTGEEKAAPAKKTVVPLYEDPNKNLTADEIASLFESYSS